jgi:hypothetical protein
MGAAAPNAGVSMTPIVQAVYSELLERASRAPHATRARALRDAFAERCGGGSEGKSEAREDAAWEDALVKSGLAREIGSELMDASERDIARTVARAQRGIYVFERMDDCLVAKDLWSRAELLLAERDHVGRELGPGDLSDNSPICQARIVASSEGCVLLPGTIFHPMDARPAIVSTLNAARERRLRTDEAMDALLRMEHTFRTLSRVKVGFAYRPEALPR